MKKKYFIIGEKMKFEELNIHKKLIDETCEQGFEELTPIQEKCLPEIIKEKMLWVKQKQAQGKHLCFVFPY